MTQNRIIVFTGDGKGKTTAALGIVLRACGHEMPTYFIQFMKSAPSGELTIMEKLPKLTIERFGLGFVPKPDYPEFSEHQQVAQEGLQSAKKVIKSKAYQVVILDEILGAIGAHLIETEQVVALIKHLPKEVTLVLTGRDAPQEIVDLADTVTEMKPIKHGYEIGIQAQKGVEF